MANPYEPPKTDCVKRTRKRDGTVHTTKTVYWTDVIFVFSVIVIAILAPMVGEFMYNFFSELFYGK